MGVTRWLWVRHAPTDPAGRIVGRTDIPIIPPDTEQVTRTATLLHAADVVLCSPLMRCRTTVNLLRDQHPTLPAASFHDDLMEQHFGTWEGLIHTTVDAWDGLDLAAMADVRAPEGESFRDVVARVETLVRRLGVEHEGRTIAIMAHAGVIRAAAVLALDMPVHRGLSLAVAPLSVTAISDHGTGGWGVDYINRV